MCSSQWRFCSTKKERKKKGVESLTDTAETLLAKPDEHVQAEIAVGRPVKVLQAPNMVSIVFYVLLVCVYVEERERKADGREKHKDKAQIEKKKQSQPEGQPRRKPKRKSRKRDEKRNRDNRPN